ncbi:MAG: DNA adenine methylase [Muribaculaceae bacterium]
MSKPFVKWVGGKGKLISQLTDFLPPNFYKHKDVTYIEPFVGGGAMLFHLLSSFPNIKQAIINDINPDLINCYKTIRDNAHALIQTLKNIENEYYSKTSEEERKDFFLKKREIYNTKNLSNIDNAALFIFLNRTCFNGLYRVNKSGKFNVPFGKYSNPTICDINTLLEDSKILNRVEIICGDFENTLKYANGYTLFYLDPPYRPISNTSSFVSYSKESFNDDSQVRLKKFCDIINDLGHSFLLSNSDSKESNSIGYFDLLYSEYHIERVLASRSINCNPDKRGKINEIIVHNYILSERKRIPKIQNSSINIHSLPKLIIP